MAYRRRRKSPLSSLITFAIAWAILSEIFPLYEIWGLLLTAGICGVAAFLVGRAVGKREGTKVDDKGETAGHEIAQELPHDTLFTGNPLF